jgi:osmotically-inducible protein OsmY
MTTAILPRTDESIRQDIENELGWVHGIDAARVGVGVGDGVVTLSGQVPHLWLRHDIAEAALRIRGVRGVANDIEVVYRGTAPTDADIAGAIAHQLRWTGQHAEGAVTPEVHDGLVTLRGTVEHDSERRAIVRQARAVRGVRWIMDEIALTPRASSTDTKDRIRAALERNATIDADAIAVEVDGTTLTLRGEVGSWDEKHQAEITAWGSPNVTEVHNHLAVVPR